MSTKKEAPVGATNETSRKDTKLYQLQQTQIAFFSQPITMMQAARQVNTDRANTCRYVATMRKENAIWLVRRGVCPVTRADNVGFYTTNPAFAESLPQQLKLF